MKRVFCLFAMLAAAAVSAPMGAAQRAAGRAMTIEDLIAAVRISDPQLSPDGRTVVFVRTTTDPKTGGRNADIWSVPADGSGDAKPLIGGEKTENTPRWSPDGKRLAFISNRDGAPQVYVADADGSNIRSGHEPRDGRAAAAGVLAGRLESRVRVRRLSGLPDVECNKKQPEAAEKNPVKAHRLTRLLYRHWDEWREQRPPSCLRRPTSRAARRAT